MKCDSIVLFCILFTLLFWGTISMVTSLGIWGLSHIYNEPVELWVFFLAAQGIFCLLIGTYIGKKYENKGDDA